jgi:hypothetical protein
MSVHEAWSLVCRLFAGGSPVLRAALSQSEVRACALLGPAVKPTIFDRVRVAGAGIRVIAPQSDRARGSPFASGIDWLPLEEHFSFYGGRISFIPDLARHRAEEPAPVDPTAPVCGPFSADFRWVTLPDWPHGPIRCTEGQAAVFEALWSFKGVEVDGERVMQRARLGSGKPNDLFKVKQRYKGNPDYEGPLFAYRALVRARRREGLYAMPCAGASGLA